MGNDLDLSRSSGPMSAAPYLSIGQLYPSYVWHVTVYKSGRAVFFLKNLFIYFYKVWELSQDGTVKQEITHEASQHQQQDQQQQQTAFICVFVYSPSICV